MPVAWMAEVAGTGRFRLAGSQRAKPARGLVHVLPRGVARAFGILSGERVDNCLMLLLHLLDQCHPRGLVAAQGLRRCSQEFREELHQGQEMRISAGLGDAAIRVD